MKKNILVFPCGSEIGLEIYRALRYSTHFNLIGASSTKDHGCFVYKNYISDIPYIEAKDFSDKISDTIKRYNIDLIYPTMDKVISIMKSYEKLWGCPIVAPCIETVELCLSKLKTYERLKNVVKTPILYNVNSIPEYPCFSKPDIGYGSRNTMTIMNDFDLNESIHKYPNNIICEYLPGEEYTVDCFTDMNGKLQFYGVRKRGRIMKGISVNTYSIKDPNNEFSELINKINDNISFRGAWFAQFKRNKNGELCLLEIASRIAGSSALQRISGVNLVMLTVFDFLNIQTNICKNSYDVEMDRALDEKFKINLKYKHVYVDFDDCLLLDNKNINTILVAFLYQCVNYNVKIILLTKHAKNITYSLKKLRINNLFDEIIHINKNCEKWQYINNLDSIFIDDSFAERKSVYDYLHIPVFAPDMIESLINS